jgi:tetratricopeptide (TPR) repeat protein
LEEEGLSIAESPPGEDQRRQSFYEIAPDDYQQKEDEVLFPHQDLLFQGNNPPCFYCGSREHMAHNCPSKQLTGITTTLQKLGYLSFERISNIFHSYLMNPEGVKRQEILLQAESRDQEASPGLGLYELRQIFQLRFFRNIWDSYSNDWDKVARSNNQENSTGELIWLAQDCIRVSNLPRAESLLQTCLEEYPDDYRTYCTLGFLNIERGSYSRSEQHLEAALRYARTVPQKIFLLFLLSRRYDLADDFDDALKRIREIKLMQPYCPEATYQEIILNFKQGGDQDTALGRLMSLIRMNREYYINALIDPELAPFNSMIHPQLKKLFTEIRRKAQKKAYDAQKEFFSLEQFLTEEDPEMEKAGALLSKIQDLIPTDSYFGYMDIVDLGNSVVSICRRAKSRRKEEFMNAVQEINNRLGTILSVSASYRSHLSPSARQQLRTIQSSFKQIREAATFNDFKKFKEMSVQSAEIIKELSSIALEIRRVKRILEIKTFLLLFLKNTAFILSVILFAGIFILPTIVYYLSTFSPGFDAFTGSDIRSYHKQVLIFGILGGLALAFLKSFKAFFKDKT